MTPPRDQSAAPPGSSIVAATLSFIWPGLGQWYRGNRRAAVLHALPVVIGVAIVLIQVAGGLTAFAVRLLDPTFSLTLIGLILLLALWRIVSVVDAATAGRAFRRVGRRSSVVVSALVVVTLLAHGAAAGLLWSFYDAGSRIFVSGGPDDGSEPGPSPTGPAETDFYEVPPFATPATPESRITVLITGIDKTTDRNHALNDTLLVASLDPATGTAAMISFPRDIAEFPMYGGGTYAGKINSLMSYVSRHPETYPDGPLPTLAKELSFLLGVPINYYAAVDLDGFRQMIDAVGGVTVQVERPIRDPVYDWLDGSPRGFYLAAGTQVLDSRTALAFVRSRYGAGDNDFTRAGRQQQLLLALRDKLTDPAGVARLPEVLRVAGDTVRTNVPADRLADLVALLQQQSGLTIRRLVLEPPTYSEHPPTSSTGGSYILRLHLKAVRALSVELFGEDSDFWTGTYAANGSPIPATGP